jgi:hypothetical protein
MSCARSRSRSGCSRTSASSSPTSSASRPSARSASSRRSSVPRRSSSRRRASLCAHDVSARSASAGPRQRPSASRRSRAACSGVAACASSTSLSNRSKSSSSAPTRIRYPGSRVTIGSAGASAFRSCETWYCSALAAFAGGCSPQSSSMSRSADTTSFARVRRIARRVRCLDPPRVSARPCSTTSSGPRMRNSTARLRDEASTVVRPQPKLSDPSGAALGRGRPRRTLGDQRSESRERPYPA